MVSDTVTRESKILSAFKTGGRQEAIPVSDTEVANIKDRWCNRNLFHIDQDRKLNDLVSRPAQMALPESGLLVTVLHHQVAAT